MHKPEFYKPATTVTGDDEIQNIFTVPVRRWNEQTSVDKSKYEEKYQNSLIFPGQSI